MIFDILTHKTVSKDFKLITECIFNNSQFTAESMSDLSKESYSMGAEANSSLFTIHSSLKIMAKES